MKKNKIVKKIPLLQTEQEYWNYYQTRSLTYKAIDLHNWMQYFQEVLLKSPQNEMAQRMLTRCSQEKEILLSLKETQDKKSDELLLIKDQVFNSKKPKK